MDKLIATLTQLEQLLQTRQLPRANVNWQSPYVTIEPWRGQPRPARNLQHHVFVFTTHSLQVSLFFEHLVAAFCVNRSCNQPKGPFERRLALAAITCKRRHRNPGAHRLCTAVWHEAYAVYDESRHGTVNYPPPEATDLFNQEIEDALASGFIGPEATRRFASLMRKESQ